MSDELKPCPFCNKPFEVIVDDDIVYWKHDNTSCPMHRTSSTGWVYYGGLTDELNRRPIEDALRGEVERLTAELKVAREAMRWIPVEERLPEEDQEVICMTTRKNQHSRCIRTFFSDGDFYLPWSSDIVTHWMPLPPEPRE